MNEIYQSIGDAMSKKKQKVLIDYIPTPDILEYLIGEGYVLVINKKEKTVEINWEEQ